MKTFLQTLGQVKLLAFAFSLIFISSNVALAQSITGFTPATGAIGSTVTITGTNFTNVTEVKFNTASAVSFTVNSTTQIIATVPTGATSGSIRVITGGTTVSSTS